jgi:hypothetical protein
MHGGMQEMRTFTIVGRKRGSRARGSTGRLKQTYENPKAQVLAQPHRLEAKKENRELPEAESEFGRLMCNGLISPAQHEAGHRYRLIAMAYRAVVLGGQAATPQSLSLLGVKGGGAEPSRETVNRIRKEYNRYVMARVPPCLITREAHETTTAESWQHETARPNHQSPARWLSATQVTALH